MDLATSTAGAMGHKAGVVAPLSGAYYVGAASSEMMALRNETKPLFIPGALFLNSSLEL